MTASPEFDALLATTHLEREKADGIRSLIAASKLAADYQHRAEVAEAALARVSGVLSLAGGNVQGIVTIDDIRAAMKESKS